MEEFLRRTECHFNWNLSALDVTDLSWVEKFREKIEENRSLDDPSEMIWPLKLTYAYELFAMDKGESAKVVDGVIEEIEEAQGGLTCKYRKSYMHIAYSFKAFVLVKSGAGTSELDKLVKRIQPVAGMSPIEKSAVLAMQAQVLRYYGPNGTYRCVPLQREAIRLNPEEIEFKLSLVISMNRKRHYDVTLRQHMTWSTVEEPVSIMEKLLNHPELTAEQRVSCEYFLAVAYHDFLFSLKRFSPEYNECKMQILKSCNWIHDKTDHPQILSFCADRFFHLEGDKPKGLRVIEAALKRFPFHVGVNTTASKFYEATNNWNSAAKHAQIALEGGGFGAAWLLLRYKTKLHKDFDDEGYFDNLLLLFPQMYKKQIHLNASLYYLLSKHDVVKGAQHLEMALIEDPSYDSLKGVYSTWVGRYVKPLDMAYGNIVEALKETGHSREDLSTLRSAKAKIEEVADVDTFDPTESDASNNKQVASNRRRCFSQRTSETRTPGLNTRRGAHHSPRGVSDRFGGTNWRDSAPMERGNASKSSTSASASNCKEDASNVREKSFSQWTSGAKSVAPDNTRRSTSNTQSSSSYSQRAFRTDDFNFRRGAPSGNRGGPAANKGKRGKDGA